MKKLILTLIFVTALTAQAQTIEGDWNTGNESTIIKIKSNDSVFEGKVLSSDVIKEGTLMLKNLKKIGEVYKGEIFVFKRKKWYEAELKPKSETLDITVKVGFVQKTLEWKKS